MTPPFLPGEVALLRAINGAHSPFWDAAMFLISNVGAWTFPAIALLIFLFYRRPKSEAILLLLMVGLCVAVGDVLSSTLAKPFFERLRPTHTPWLQESLALCLWLSREALWLLLWALIELYSSGYLPLLDLQRSSLHGGAPRS